MDDDEVPHRYDDGNRAFLQAFLARGTLTFKEAQPILAAIFSALDRREHGEQAEPTAAADVTQQDFESYVGAASAAASPFDMEIRSIAHQTTRERVYALVNTTSDPVTQLATLHSAEEIAFVRRVIDAIFDKYNTPRMEMLCIDGMQANKLRSVPRGGNGGEENENGNGNDSTIIGDDNSNENGNGEGAATATQTVGGLKGLKSSEVENVLRSMVESGWFERSRAGFYSLSPRALMELRSWLTDAYNDADVDAGDKTTWQRVKFCEACREVVTVGQRCAERDCLVRMHDACAEAFWQGNARRNARGGAATNGNGGARACPRCSREWTGRNFVGERAVTEMEAYQRGKRRSGRGGGRTSIVEEIVEEAQEGEGEEEEDADGDEDEDAE
ncbi:Nse1 non-SMC component of SMC5-6 complex-domain-containing protein [Hypoxylon rubiginosum]|uniref:Nse1 non-SMC component of SMC5-6 complex-domain-containing protein n=1 Tax=Hypoxylon rubiginosum TaxID=110542 RepID=A0ACC0D0L2_9PEZI|nr:Nse1 non-SMC component of SMC5-6 complex-domain-containing protein [Hypoxylon rubiginosum]